MNKYKMSTARKMYVISEDVYKDVKKNRGMGRKRTKSDKVFHNLERGIKGLDNMRKERDKKGPVVPNTQNVFLYRRVMMRTTMTETMTMISTTMKME